MFGTTEQVEKKKSRLGSFIVFFLILLLIIGSGGLFWLSKQSIDQTMLSALDGLVDNLNGYVLLEFLNYSLETTVPLLILGLLSLYILIRVVILVWNSPSRIKYILAERSAKRTKKLLNESLLLLSKGETVKARKRLKSAASSNQPILQTFLLNIELSEAAGDHDSREEWVEKSLIAFPKVKPYILNFVATLLINSKNYIDAKAYIDQLFDANPTNPSAHQLLFELLVATKDYDLVLRKVFEFDKHVDEDSLAEMFLKVIRDAVHNNKPLESILERIPKSIEKHPLVMTGKIESWLASKEHIKAESVLRKLIPNTWNKTLILIYADLDNPSINELSGRVDNWLEDRPRDSNLWLAASRLAQRDGLWSKAKQCLERSIELSYSVSKYTELSLVLSELGEKEEALAALKSARELDK